MATILTVAFAFGSAVYAFTNKYLLVMVVILFYLLLQGLLNRHRRQKYLNATVIHYAGNIFKLRGLMDSGNALTDPVTRAPVCIISLPVFLQMFPGITADQILLKELPNIVNGGHYIDCHTVHGKADLFVFPPDKIQINGTTVKDCMLGVAAKDFGNEHYEALLNIKLGGNL